MFVTKPPPLVLGWRETRGALLQTWSRTQKKSAPSAPKTPFLDVSEQPLSVCNFSQNIFVESTHDARLEGGFQRKFSENNYKTNVYCLIGAAGDFF